MRGLFPAFRNLWHHLLYWRYLRRLAVRRARLLDNGHAWTGAPSWSFEEWKRATRY